VTAAADVHLPRSLVALFPGAARRVEARGETVAELIADLDRQIPGLRNRLVDAGPVIRAHINVFVAGRRATLATPVPEGAVVHVIPAVSGGATPLAAPRTGYSQPRRRKIRYSEPLTMAMRASANG
jgi:molybdopterin converting factor small subunit